MEKSEDFLECLFPHRNLYLQTGNTVRTAHQLQLVIPSAHFNGWGK